MSRYVCYPLFCLALLLQCVTAYAATAPVFVNLGVTHNPNKTLYAPDEPLDLRGLVVSKIYSDGSSKRVYGITTANASGFDSSTPGEKTVMIQYQGNWCTFDVMVKATSEKSSGFYRVKGESVRIRTENNDSAVGTVLGSQTQLTMVGANSAGGDASFMLLADGIGLGTHTVTYMNATNAQGTSTLFLVNGPGKPIGTLTITRYEPDYGMVVGSFALKAAGWKMDANNPQAPFVWSNSKGTLSVTGSFKLLGIGAK